MRRDSNEESHVHLPGPLRLVLALASAVLLGWIVHALTDELGATRQPAAAAAAQAATATRSTPRHTDRAGPPVHVTIVLEPASPDASRPPPQELAGKRSAPATSPPAAGNATASNETQHPTAPSEAGSDRGLVVMANGNDIVIANNGAIVSVGDNTVLHGNTGSASSSGSIALDVSDSSITSGSSSVLPGDAGADRTPAQMTSGPPGPVDPAARSAAGARSDPGVATGTRADGAPGPPSRATALAGYEVHSIAVDGSDNLVSYDDSALFFHRTGTLNANTGDAAASGLNVVDAIGSRVRSGDSSRLGSLPDAAAPPGAPSGVLAGPGAGGGVATVADANGISTALAQDTLVVGGDGVVDHGVRIHGDRNVVTYDDGNVAVGGSGDVNSQIGDSDSGGTVVMAVRASDIEAGDAVSSTGGT
jgi:hypothetical protein